MNTKINMQYPLKAVIKKHMMINKPNLLSCLMLCALAASQANAVEMEYADGRILIKPAANVSDKALNAVLQNHNASTKSVIGGINIHVINVPSGAEQAVVNALSHNPNIELAELDKVNELTEIIPDDPYYTSAWHLPKINAPLAWDLSTGNSVVVAVLDSGIDPDHPDLGSRLLRGFNTVDNSTNTDDIAGHGTKVAGVIGAISNNATGVTSIAWNTHILPLRVSNQSSGSAYTSDLAEAVTWAADNGAHIVNASYALSFSSSINSAASYLKDKGGVMVVSAGNDGSEWIYGDSANLISVSATSSSDTKTSWSSYGSYVDVAAPGAGIYTTSNGGGYASVSGTSFSAPLTAGVLALIKAANWDLTPTQMEGILEDSAIDLGAAGFDNNFGHGRIDAHAAVQLALNTSGSGGGTPTDTTAPTISFNLASTTLSGVESINVTASDNTAVANLELTLTNISSNLLLASVSGDTINIGLDTTQLVDGPYTLIAVATDTNGNVSEKSLNINVANNVANDTTPPSVSVSNLADGDIVSSNMKARVNATDDVSLSMIYCYANGALISSSNISPLDCNINTKKLKSGSHTFSARALDMAGNESVTSVSFTIGTSSGDTDGGTKGGGKGRKK